jgi:hypothetical protein
MDRERQKGMSMTRTLKVTEDCALYYAMQKQRKGRNRMHKRRVQRLCTTKEGYTHFVEEEKIKHHSHGSPVYLCQVEWNHASQRPKYHEMKASCPTRPSPTTGLVKTEYSVGIGRCRSETGMTPPAYRMTVSKFTDLKRLAAAPAVGRGFFRTLFGVEGSL